MGEQLTTIMAEPLSLSLADVGRLWHATFAPPWGPFNTLHEYVMRTAAPLDFEVLTFRQAFNYCFVPFVPLIIIAYLIVGGPNDKLARSTRQLRMALGVAGWAIVTRAYLSNRFVALRWCCYNSMFGILYWQLSARYFSLAFLKDPVVDPYMSLGRPRWVAALDLMMNQRHLGLGSLGFDTSSGPANITLQPLKPGQKPKIERHYHHWRRYPRPTTRLGSSLRHLLKAFGVYVFLDTMFTLNRTIGPDAIAPPAGLPLIDKYGHVMAGWLAESEGVLFPSTLRWPMPKGLMRFFMELTPPLGIYGFMTIGYHMTAFVCIAPGGWEVESFDIDMFDAPLKSTSLMMLWGKRWHQTFRHTFIDAAELVMQTFHIPNNVVTFYTLVYLFSGMLHSMGEITASPVPEWTSVMVFFTLAGVGCSLEIIFKRLTGIKIRGVWGWVWTWLWTAYTGLSVANAWVDAGFAACSFFPDAGVGRLLAPLVLKHVYMIYHVPPGAALEVAAPAAAMLAEGAGHALLADGSVAHLARNVVEAMHTATAGAKAALETVREAVLPTVAAAAKAVAESLPVEAVPKVADSLAEAVFDAAAPVAEAVSESAQVVAAAVSESAQAVAETLSESVQFAAEGATPLSALLATSASAAALAKAAVENLSTAAEPAAAGAVKFITVDSVPSAIVQAALTEASAAASAAASATLEASSAATPA